MNRRTFLKSSAAAGLGGLCLVGAGCSGADGSPEQPMQADLPAAGRALDRIGVQLYTVRGLMQEDVARTLAQVAAVGYDEVEFAGYFDHPPDEIKGMLDAVGMTAPSAHVPYGMLRDDLDGVLAAAQTVGHQYLVCPWLDANQRSLDQYRAHAAFFNEVGAACHDAGVQFAYHNHDFEFEAAGGQLPYDLLLDETDAAFVQMELDLFWIAKAGHDPLAYFARDPGRFSLCHVKDMAADARMVSVGAGTIDFGSIFAQSEQAGLVHYFVEHDNPDDPMQSITASYAYLKALRF